jgi:TonB family protein
MTVDGYGFNQDRYRQEFKKENMNTNHKSIRRAIFRSFAAAAAMLGLVALLGADDAKKISTEEAMAAVVSKVAPEYPVLAKQLKLTGTVEVQATIDEDGAVSDVTTVSGNPVLAKAASDAVKKWKFKPFKSKVMSNFTVGFHGV